MSDCFDHEEYDRDDDRVGNYKVFKFDEIIAETDKAILFALGTKEVWLPKSQMIELDIPSGTCQIKTWLVSKIPGNFVLA